MATQTTETNPLTGAASFSIREIMDIIPHRYPFLLVDKVTQYEPGQSITGYKNVTINEPFFTGHFEGNPIMPGVLQLEALAQLGGILVSLTPEGKDKLGLFAGIDNARFRRPVIPGDRLDMEAKLLRLRPPIVKLAVSASVNGETAVEAEVIFALSVRLK